MRDYLVTDRRELQAWQHAGGAPATEEKLLIEECDGELALALYLDSALLDRLDVLDPRERLCGRNLADFALALEGISHFNYVAWNAALDKSVTLLELEMQAEIDKYVTARMLLGQQAGSDLHDGLLAQLFDAPGFDDRLAPAELDRYRDANRLAGRYCRSLQRRFPAHIPRPEMLGELRAFFRWPAPAKVRHIRSAALS